MIMRVHAGESSAHRPLHVLVVDDQVLNRDLFVRALGQIAEATAVPLASAAEALVWCRDQTPDLVLLDFHLPGMDGMECLAALRAQPMTREVPVMLVTADTDRDVRYKALQQGADDFLAKPVDVFELRLRARNLLRLRVAREAAAQRYERLTERHSVAQTTLDARDMEFVTHLTRMAEWRSVERGNHLPRVAHASELIARGLGLPAAMVDRIFNAAPLHDIGMLALPPSLCLKPGALSEHDIESVHEHTTAGEAMLAHSSSAVLATASEIAGGHHEWYDGSGYPRRRREQQIPLAARIVAVADVLDALTLPRPWRDAWTWPQARSYIESRAGTQFDPDCVAVLVERWQEVLAIRDAFPPDAGYADAFAAEAAAVPG